MENENRELNEEEETCKPLTDEKFKAFQEQEKKTEKKIRNFFDVIWSVFNFFTRSRKSGTRQELIVMKRIPALCLAVLLLFCCMAGAEDESLSAVDFEDFTLQPGVPLTYRGEKTDGMPLFAFSLTVEGNIALSAVNAVWSREQAQLTPEEFTGSVRNTESEIRSRYEAGGYVLQSLDVRDAVECEYWGQPALRCDAQMQVNINDTEVIIVQRTIRITGSFGTYLFSLSSWSSDYLEEADDALVRAIRWKQP